MTLRDWCIRMVGVEGTVMFLRGHGLKADKVARVMGMKKGDVAAILKGRGWEEIKEVCDLSNELMWQVTKRLDGFYSEED